MQKRMSPQMILPRSFLRQCRKAMFRPKVADTTGVEMTGGSLLMRTLIFKRLLEREVLDPDEKYVGLLLPPSAGAVLANAALPLMGRIPVNLNYTVSTPIMRSCIEQCGIRHVLTSRRVMEKLDIEIDVELVYLEEVREKVTIADKLASALAAYAMPMAFLERMLNVHKIKPEDLLTVLFTSGSTGDPKGVMLSHANVAANIRSIDKCLHLGSNDVAIGVLPFFHSYGYTATLWTVLALDPKGVYHYSPLEAKPIGKLAREHRATILMATPSFLRNYLKRCQPEDFASLDVIFASAERLPLELSDAFEAKFGIRPLEAFGATELAPLACLNIPSSRSQEGAANVAREGTIGRPIPDVIAKILHPETGEELATGEEGLLYFKGANVMKGYLHQPELTAKVVRDGWYETGDIARIDEDGFVTITGRQSRFSKIAGEMVPHIKIEETLQKILTEDAEQLVAVVTAVPDEKRGERIVVMHTTLSQSPEEIRKALANRGLPNLWIPAQDSFFEVDEIPVLGTGKLDLKALKTQALERYGIAAPSN